MPPGHTIAPTATATWPTGRATGGFATSTRTARVIISPRPSRARPPHTLSLRSEPDPVFVPILNIALGIGMILGGASGRLALLGTGSATALIVVGAICAGLGVWQLIRATRERA